MEGHRNAALVFLGIGLLAYAFVRTGTAEAVLYGREAFWRHALWGFILLILVPVAAIILLATVIGIPIGIIGILYYIALLMLLFLCAAPAALSRVFYARVAALR
ncbi:MAG: hypothetical protein Q8R13_05185 [bacterium]|nr:hypothetical protein [bacterium]MDZ4296540.1 hypothetical protein [Patescibacteria group bacterium]